MSGDKKRDYSMCWSTYVKPRGSNTYFFSYADEALEDLKNQEIPIQRGDYVWFKNWEYETEDDDEIFGFLMVFNGEKLVKLIKEPGENGYLPSEILCFDEKDFRVPSSFFNCPGDYESDDPVCECREPSKGIWFKPGPFLKQMRQNLRVNKKGVPFTTFVVRREKYTLLCDFEDFETMQESFKQCLDTADKNTLFFAKLENGILFLCEPFSLT